LEIGSTGDRAFPKTVVPNQGDGGIPNNPELSLLLYPGALSVSDDLPSECAALVRENGWGGAWRDGVFSYHHYHSTAQEVLGLLEAPRA